MRGKRITLYALCVAAAIILVLLFLHLRRRPSAVAEEHPRTPEASVVRASIGNVARQLTLAGIFQPYQEIDVHGKVSGYIRRIYVDIGDRVRQGETLAVLEVPELQAQVAGAQAGVSQSQQDIARLQNEVAREQANYVASHANYTRLKQASDQQPGLIAAQELDDALARDRSAAAQVDAAKSAVAVAGEQLGVSRADRMRVGSMEQYATITAPFSGVITMRYADTGALIPAGTSEGNAQAVVRLAQSDVLRLRMPVPEQDVPLVHVGSQVTVQVQATGQKFPGKVVRFTRDVSNSTRTMMTEVDVDNPTLGLAPGMYAEVTFTLQQKGNALLVPSAAIIQGDQPSVLIVDGNGEVQRRNVALGIAGANTQEILSGLAPGDEVVTGGQATLQPGEHVYAKPAPMDLVGYQAESPKGNQ